MARRILSAGVCLAAVLGCTQWTLLTRDAGERIVEFPEAVAKEYNCSKRRLPFLKVEETELIPHRVKPGRKINHRFVYSMCPSRISGVIEGKLYTRVHYRGTTIYNEVNTHVLQPGRWVVETTKSEPLPRMSRPSMPCSRAGSIALISRSRASGYSCRM